MIFFQTAWRNPASLNHINRSPELGLAYGNWLAGMQSFSFNWKGQVRGSSGALDIRYLGMVRSGYKFNVKPTCEIIKQDEDDVSAYSIVETNWDGDQNQITFTVKYVYSTNNPTEDRLLFTAHAEKIFVDPDTQVTAFHASSKPISRRGEDRTMTIAGMEGVTFKFKKKYSIAGVDLDSNGAGNYSDFDFWNPALNSGAGGWQDGDATITMGNTGLYAITESYGSSSATKSFNYQMIKVSPNPFIIREHYNLKIFNAYPGSTIRIHKLSGKLIKSFELSEPFNGICDWDGKDSNGNYLSSGIYLISSSHKKKGNSVTKLAVIN